MKQRRETIHTLTWDINGTRYALDHSSGKALAEGDRLALQVAPDQWVAGTIKQVHRVQVVTEKGLMSGYHFLSDEGVIIGLCSGMRVLIGSM